MNKAGLVEVVRAKTGFGKGDSEVAVNATIDGIIEALEAGEDVKLVGLGQFLVKDVKAGTSRNPQTGAPVQVEAHQKVAFKKGSRLKAIR